MIAVEEFFDLKSASHEIEKFLALLGSTKKISREELPIVFVP